MEQHRADPNCAACHLDMDAMGFAFENYDAIGSYRETDQGHPIDPSGSLLGETDFANGLELTTLLSAHPQVGSCLTEKMLIYALGRGLHQEEACMVEAVADTAAPGRFQPQTLIKAIAQHDMFQKKMNTPIATEEVTP